MMERNVIERARRAVEEGIMEKIVIYKKEKSCHMDIQMKLSH